MNDEIKEIFNTKLYFDLDEEDYIKIKDYITNLQQDNEMYAQLKDEYEEEIKDLQQIEQEHKKLNAELRQENSNLKTSLDEAQEVLSEYKEENERLKRILDEMGVNPNQVLDYKSRCEKASEYINNNSYFKDNVVKTMIFKDYSSNLLNILQNGSENDE